MTVSQGGSQGTTISTGFPTPLEVLVVDGSNAPKPGVVVTFSAPISGASAQLSALTATTGVNGIASVTVSHAVLPSRSRSSMRSNGILPCRSLASWTLERRSSTRAPRASA